MNQITKHPILTRATTAIIGRMNIFLYLFLNSLLELLSLTNNKNNIWVIGENRGECLKENGYWFYKYCRKNHPDLPVYFIVKKISPYYREEFQFDNNTVKYGSLKHASVFFRSSFCLYTHTYRDVMYRRLFEIFGKKKTLIFLHHGVLGFKKFNKFYHRHRNIMELFTVGSNLEKKILIEQEKVNKYKIKVLGYPRYDHLFNSHHNPTRQIVFIPTHRNYLKGKFTNSLFFHRVSSLVNNPILSDILTENKISLKVCFHKEMQSYIDLITPPVNSITFIKHGEETPQSLISESHLMITDYSSVCWDFFYLGKPVIFYRFDIEDYTKDRDSYIDLYDEIIGDIAFEEENLLELIRDQIENNFKIKNRYSVYRNKISPNIDRNNCMRIYNEVKLIQND